MKRIIVFYLFCLSVVHCFASPVSLSQEIYEEATRIFETMHETHYDHHSSIDEKQGYYSLDCSGFVCHILQKKAPMSLRVLPVDKHHTHARAQNFYDYFKSLQNVSSQKEWMPILRIKDLEEGDIIAWKYDPSLQKKDTGHVVIVQQKPLLEEGNLYRIRVIDSSKGKHANDTRAKEKDGIGSGDMWFRVDESDYPIGLYWSSKEKKESQHPIAMGRALK